MTILSMSPFSNYNYRRTGPQLLADSSFALFRRSSFGIVILGNNQENLPFIKPGVMLEEEEKNTDLPLLKHGSLTALEIQEDGDVIRRIRARWAPSPP